MDNPDLLPNYNSDSESNYGNTTQNEEVAELRDQVLSNIQKPLVPNVNVPEKIIICLDVCYDNPNSIYHISDGTTFSPINMMKIVLDFFLHSKHAINKKTEFALIILKNSEPCWIMDFTSHIKDVINTIDYLNPEQCNSETFDLSLLFELIKEKVVIPQFRQGVCTSPSYVVRMIMLYTRSNCVPVIPQDPFFNFLKQHIYFYIDILLAHEEDCAKYKCVEIYDVLQDLDNGYSYVFEFSKMLQNFMNVLQNY